MHLFYEFLHCRLCNVELELYSKLNERWHILQNNHHQSCARKFTNLWIPKAYMQQWRYSICSLFLTEVRHTAGLREHIHISRRKSQGLAILRLYQQGRLDWYAQCCARTEHQPSGFEGYGVELFFFGSNQLCPQLPCVSFSPMHGGFQLHSRRYWIWSKGVGQWGYCDLPANASKHNEPYDLAYTEPHLE